MNLNLHRGRGFSLMELVIVVIIVGIMAAVLSPLMVSSLRAYDNTLGDLVVMEKLRYATERLAREIREVQYASSTVNPSPACPGGDILSATTCSNLTSPNNTERYCIGTMTTSSLIFNTSFCDSSGTVTSRTVTIGTTSTVSASCVTAPCVTLAYSDMPGTGAQVLTDELGATTNLTFAYYQQDGTTAATLAGNADCKAVATCVSYVEITLKLRHNNNDYVQRTRVGLRNLPTS